MKFVVVVVVVVVSFDELRRRPHNRELINKTSRLALLFVCCTKTYISHTCLYDFSVTFSRQFYFPNTLSLLLCVLSEFIKLRWRWRWRWRWWHVSRTMFWFVDTKTDGWKQYRFCYCLLVYSDGQQTSALSCATVLYLDFVKCVRNCVMAAL